MSDEIHIIAKIHHGGLGQIILNRPQALNALSLEMIVELRATLKHFQENKAVRAIVITSNSDKAFCAGGDVKAVAIEARHMQQGESEGILCREIFRQEYLLNREIHNCSKPYAALIDGICMGGGMGVSLHGSHRVVTERTMFAMPEVFIGFFPDVGSGYIFNTVPAGVGAWLLLTGKRLSGGDMLHLGLASHFIEARGMEVLLESLIATDWSRSDATTILQAQLAGYCEERILVEDNISPLLPEITACFDHGDLNDILARLTQNNGEFAKESREAMGGACPLSLVLTFAHLHWAKGRDFDAIMQNEFRLSQFFMTQHDFYEGVRAALIDKDNAPVWRSDLKTLPPDLYSDVQNEFSELTLSDIME